jgi:hypothetical protein
VCSVPSLALVGCTGICPASAADGQPIRGERERQAIYEVVRAHLMGTSVQQQQLVAAGAGRVGPLHGEAGEVGGGAAPSAGGSGHDTHQQSILRALSGKWKFG